MPIATGPSISTSSAGDIATAARGRDRPLNPALRPQRLFHKVGIAMKAIDKRLFDESITGLSKWLSDEDMATFRRTCRRIIRDEYDATFDTWPKRVLHNYVPDARKAIEQAINEHWEDMFDTPKVADEDLYDDFVPGELLFPRFYTE